MCLQKCLWWGWIREEIRLVKSGDWWPVVMQCLYFSLLDSLWPDISFSVMSAMLKMDIWKNEQHLSGKNEIFPKFRMMVIVKERKEYKKERMRERCYLMRSSRKRKEKSVNMKKGEEEVKEMNWHEEK